MVNKVMLIGRLGNDPDIKTTTSGTSVGNLRIATTSRVKKSADGPWEDETTWHSVVVFGKNAEFAGQYVKKGRLVYVEGRIRTNTYTKDGVTKTNQEIVADEFKALDRPPEGGEARPTGGSPPPAGRGRGKQDDDIPF